MMGNTPLGNQILVLGGVGKTGRRGQVNASGSWTLTEAAHPAGVHPATLVKRFGSKHAVLVALSKR